MARKPAPKRRGATRSAPAAAKEPQNDKWFFFVLGLAIGLIVSWLAYLSFSQSEPKAEAEAQAQVAEESKDKKEKVAEQDDENSPYFDFYAVLPDMEVVVPKEDMPKSSSSSSKDSSSSNVAKAKPIEEPKESSSSKKDDDDKLDDEVKPDKKGNYMLQAGSFKSNEDAERRRAELGMQNLQAKVQPVELDSGDTWHRVMIGPYEDVDSMHTAKEKLASAGIETLAIRVKN